MPNAHTMSNGSMVKQIHLIGHHHHLTQMVELENTVHVVLKWISGKPILKILKLPPILAPLPDKQDALELNVEIIHLEIDIKEFVIKMVVILTHLD